jgi:hypothetical protein
MSAVIQCTNGGYLQPRHNVQHPTFRILEFGADSVWAIFVPKIMERTDQAPAIPPIPGRPAR